MDTTFWGPSGWVFLHSIIALYPENPSIDDNMLIITNFLIDDFTKRVNKVKRSLVGISSKNPLYSAGGTMTFY